MSWLKSIGSKLFVMDERGAPVQSKGPLSWKEAFCESLGYSFAYGMGMILAMFILGEKQVLLRSAVNLAVLFPLIAAVKWFVSRKGSNSRQSSTPPQETQ